MAKSVVGTPSNLELVLEHITLAEVLILQFMSQLGVHTEIKVR
jgi:hypothetical protein